MDSSDSIQEADPENGQYKNWDLILQFIISIIKRFLIGPSDTRVSVVVFATDAYVEFKLDAYDTETELIAKVKSIGYRGGNTNTAEALRLTTDGNASTVLPPIWFCAEYIQFQYNYYYAQTASSADFNNTYLIFSKYLGRASTSRGGISQCC